MKDLPTLPLTSRLKLGWRRLTTGAERPQWIKEPAGLAHRQVCCLASHSIDGSISRHTNDLAKAWDRQGFAVILVVAADRPSRSALERFDTAHLAGLLLRKNRGYDFGSWAAAIAACDDVAACSLLALANDSVYGPLDGFDVLLERVKASVGDIVGMTDSYERVHHLQSYLVFYKPGALRSPVFRKFWKKRPLGDRLEVIVQGELPLLRMMTGGGLKVEVLFPAASDRAINTTLGPWRELLAAGFPFVKVQLLRDNPHDADIGGWDVELAKRGYDPARVVEDIGSNFVRSAACATMRGTATR